MRHDTADIRLLAKGYEVGLQTEEARGALALKQAGLDEIKELLRKRPVQQEDSEALPVLKRHFGRSFFRALRDPQVHIVDLLTLEDRLAATNKEWLYQTELDIKYEGYINRQEKQVERFRKMEEQKIPSNFDYDRAMGLSAEAVEKFKTVRPLSVGQASRISGVRSSDIAVLLVHLKKR